MYTIINNLPIDYNFSSKTKEELKEYGLWFIENKNSRIKSLIDSVKSTPEFEKWEANFKLNSLKDLGKWLTRTIETEKLSKDQYNEKKAMVPDYITIKDWVLTIKSRSILVDTAIYFGETFIKENAGLKWEQSFSKNKKDVNHGHIIIKLKKMELNPVWLLYILGNKLVDKESNNVDCLYNLFKVWEKFV
ncbi:hypothetical protein B0A67_18970 [Flavobacterium aquidurense]|uniref:hypothetical protein n=1 Tax=Flavobacterium aquidurense TaxID=362413 RepID=UPI000911896C|nr:hypothetical protein [Flavobacterium aquidurense]OXA69793.1 hypothetical protein B0A67_18970 [Flavobacterium aquidurense]SHH25668.1 hypothetical protein SAMN05444481_1146 [Flavobacterium frigidimaris]